MRPTARRLGAAFRPALIAGGAALALYGLGTDDPYAIRLLTTAGTYALMVIGYQFVFGHAGALSLAQGAFFGLGAYVTGILGSQLGWDFAATFPLSIALPAFLAAAIAAPILRLESHYFALATLGIGQVVWLIAVNWDAVTGGANGLPGVPGVAVFGAEIAAGTPMLLFVWAIVAFGAGLAWVVMRGLYGRRFAVMRADDLAARCLGIDGASLRFAAFVLSAGYGGAAGALYVHGIGVISPEALEFTIMVACLSMAVIGGRAYVSGAILGAVLLVHLPEWFRFLDSYYMVAYGLGMLAMVILAPYGIIGGLARWRRRYGPEAPTDPGIAKRETKSAPGDRPILDIRGVSKAFGGVAAIEWIDLDIHPGEIVGLIGPNGSGKTTLVNLISGLYAPDTGRIAFKRRDITGLPAHRVARAGIARSFQAISLVGDMTARDNVALARPTRTGAGLWQALHPFAAARSEAAAEADANARLAALGIGEVAGQLCGSLPHGTNRLVEIARAWALEPELLILDEPAAGLNEAEQAALGQRLAELAASGVALLVIEHDMGFLMPLAGRMICLDSGRVIATGNPAEIRSDPGVRKAYLGGLADR